MTIELEAQVTQEQELEKVASGLHGVIGSRLNRHLGNYVDDKQLGYVVDSSTTFEVKDKPPKREPDVSFVRLEKMPVPLDETLPFAPDLAVEIVSKNDVAYEIEQKVKHYQEWSVPLIWVIYPFSQTVHIYRLRSGLLAQVIGSEGELDGEDVVPGFKLPVSKLFK